MKKLLVLLFLLSSVPVSAQDVHTLIFTASPDHAAALNGTPVLTSYQLDVVVGTATGALAFSQNLGKPTPATPVPPATAGDITVDLSQFAAFNALTRNAYVVFVSSVGPGGTTRSAASDPFPHFGLPAQTGKPRIQ